MPAIRAQYHLAMYIGSRTDAETHGRRFYKLPSLPPSLLPRWPRRRRSAAERTQLLATTHLPFFLNALRPEEVRVLNRDERGFTQTTTASEIRGVPEFVASGASLGHLRLEGRFGAGDPLISTGASKRNGKWETIEYVLNKRGALKVD